MLKLAIRAALNWVALLFLMIGTAAVVFPQSRLSGQDIRIEGIERSLEKTATYGERLVKLEDGVAQLHQDAEEARWWYRAIGGALILAVVERILRTAGVLGKTDGMGPLG